MFVREQGGRQRLLPADFHPPPLSQRRAVWGVPALQRHRPAPLLPGDPDGPTLAGAERRQRGGHGRLDAVLLPGCLQRGELGTDLPLPTRGFINAFLLPQPLWELAWGCLAETEQALRSQGKAPPCQILTPCAHPLQVIPQGVAPTPCVPCCLVLTDEKAFTCHEDCQTSFFRSLGTAELCHLSAISTEAGKEYCILVGVGRGAWAARGWAGTPGVTAASLLVLRSLLRTVSSSCPPGSSTLVALQSWRGSSRR